MAIFDRFKPRRSAPPPAPEPGPGERLVGFHELGMH